MNRTSSTHTNAVVLVNGFRCPLRGKEMSGYTYPCSGEMRRAREKLLDGYERLESEKLAQALGLGAAYGDLGLLLVIHAELVGTLEPGDHFLDSIDIHEI